MAGRVGVGGLAALSDKAFCGGEPEKHGAAPSLTLPTRGREMRSPWQGGITESRTIYPEIV